MANVTRRSRGRARGSARNPRGGRLLDGLGRFGDVCYGVVHLVVAWLALQVAFGVGAPAADQKGAITEIAAQPYGQLLLWLLAIGLAAFGGWQLLAAADGYRWVRDKSRRTRKRLGSAGRALAGLLIAVSTLRLLLGGSVGSGNAQQQEFTAQLMALPGGRVLVVVVGVIVLALAVVTFRRGWRATFLDDLDTGKLSPATRRLVTRLGRFGCLAKAVAYGVIGILLLVAAARKDAAQAGGLDKALRTMAAQPFGVVLLVVVAIGFASYGLFCFADARCRRG